MKKIIFILLLLTLLSGCKNDRSSEIKSAFNSYKGKYLIYISKRDFTLDVYNRQVEKLISCSIAFGANPDMGPKRFSGDNRTPEGKYYINEMLSMDAGTGSSSYRKLERMNRVYFRANDHHHKYGKPDVDLGDNAYGPRYFGINYPNGEDRKNYSRDLKAGNFKPVNEKIPGIGSGIAIHGNCDEASIGHLSSSGCIRMYNDDIVELERYIQISVPVIISAE